MWWSRGVLQNGESNGELYMNNDVVNDVMEKQNHEENDMKGNENDDGNDDDGDDDEMSHEKNDENRAKNHKNVMNGENYAPNVFLFHQLLPFSDSHSLGILHLFHVQNYSFLLWNPYHLIEHSHSHLPHKPIQFLVFFQLLSLYRY
jgi:hypothetical protein